MRRAPHNLLASTGRLRIFVSAVVRHSNIGQCAEKGLLSVALCHSTLRSCMEVGDVALLISCSRQTPKVEPHVYKEALDGNRRLVSVFRVTFFRQRSTTRSSVSALTVGTGRVAKVTL